MSRMSKKMIVVLAQSMILPHQAKSASIRRAFTVYASTKPRAVKAVRDAGHKGRLVEVILG